MVVRRYQFLRIGDGCSSVNFERFLYCENSMLETLGTLDKCQTFGFHSFDKSWKGESCLATGQVVRDKDEFVARH